MRALCLSLLTLSCGGQLAHETTDASSVDAPAYTGDGSDDACAAPCVTVLAPVTHPDQLAIDSERVFWVDIDVRVASVPIAGGVVTTLAQKPTSSAIALDDSSVFWVSNTGLVSLPKSGGSLTLFEHVNPTDISWGIAVRGGAAYWLLSHTPGAVKKVEVDGGAVFWAVTSLQTPVRIVVDDANIYWTSPDGVGRSDLGGGAVVTLFGGASTGLAIDATRVYWTTPSAIMSANHDGNDMKYVASNEDQPACIAIDDTYVYWSNGAPAMIKRAPKMGGAITTVVASRATDIAVNDTSVFWADADQHSIMKLSK